MIQLAIDALAGYGLLSLAATGVLILVLCVDWRAWRRRRTRQRTHMAARCQHCNYTDRVDKVRLHEMRDHPQTRGEALGLDITLEDPE